LICDAGQNLFFSGLRVDLVEFGSPYQGDGNCHSLSACVIVLPLGYEVEKLCALTLVNTQRPPSAGKAASCKAALPKPQL